MNYKINRVDIKLRNQTIPFDAREDRAMLGSNLSARALPGHLRQKPKWLLPSQVCLGEKAINPRPFLMSTLGATGFSLFTGVTFGNIRAARYHMILVLPIEAHIFLAVVEIDSIKQTSR
jgi:hypothetical protein